MAGDWGSWVLHVLQFSMEESGNGVMGDRGISSILNMVIWVWICGWWGCVDGI